MGTGDVTSCVASTCVVTACVVTACIASTRIASTRIADPFVRRGAVLAARSDIPIDTAGSIDRSWPSTGVSERDCPNETNEPTEYDETDARSLDRQLVWCLPAVLARLPHERLLP